MLKGCGENICGCAYYSVYRGKKPQEEEGTTTQKTVEASDVCIVYFMREHFKSIWDKIHVTVM